jgi:phospholipase/carboxylesterase
MSRRRFFAVAGAGTLAGCATAGTSPGLGDAAHVTLKPVSPARPIGAGEHRLELESNRDGVLFVPTSVRTDASVPFLLMLHGAGGSAARIRFAFDLAAELGVVVLAPDSRGTTWDAIRGAFGPDVAFISAALQHSFDRVAVDPRRLGVGGFSDGASYALALAIANGDLFTHALAFSPGFIPPVGRHGNPRVFISHGTQDQVLPIERTSRTIVPDLQSRGYDVRYREFDGPHSVPRSLAREAFKWFAG